MIRRVVRLTIAEDKTKDFEEIFQASKDRIRAFDGCTYLSLHTDLQKKNIYYTISHWNDFDDLEAYRKSALFRTTWAKTKLLFSDKPLAFSLEQVDELH